MISITIYPNKPVGNDDLNVSKWSAVHHPIKFEIKRRDYEVALGKNGASLTVTFSVTASTLLTVGDTLFFQTNSSTYYGTAIVVSISGYTATCTITTGSLPFNQYGFVNLDTRLNYYIKTKVWGVEGLVGDFSYYLLGTSINKPNGQGVASVDVSTFLKSNVDYINEFGYDVLNALDSNLGGMFNITISENWTGYEGAFSGISETDLNYYTNSAKQIQDTFGSNMGEYVPFLGYGVGETKAKFLSAFASPTYFKDFPFDLSFIYSELIWGFELNKHEETINSNGTALATSNNALSFSEGVGVHRMMLVGDYASNVKTVNVYLDNTSGGTLPPLPVEIAAIDTGYVDAGYFESETTITVSTANLETS